MFPENLKTTSGVISLPEATSYDIYVYGEKPESRKVYMYQNVREYDKVVPQSHTADQPTAPAVRKRNRTLAVTRHQEDN